VPGLVLAAPVDFDEKVVGVSTERMQFGLFIAKSAIPSTDSSSLTPSDEGPGRTSGNDS
jgi:hypothetical protein